jgi:hypothetical protein
MTSCMHDFSMSAADTEKLDQFLARGALESAVSRNHRLWCRWLGLNTRSILRNGDLMGRLIDSFVVAQLRPELGISETMPTMNHLRLEDGRREIDIILEAPDGRVVAIEIKAGAEPGRTDAKTPHLAP